MIKYKGREVTSMIPTGVEGQVKVTLLDSSVETVSKNQLTLDNSKGPKDPVGTARSGPVDASNEAAIAADHPKVGELVPGQIDPKTGNRVPYPAGHVLQPGEIDPATGKPVTVVTPVRSATPYVAPVVKA